MVLTQKLDFEELEQNRSYRIFIRAIQSKHTLKTYKYHLKNFLKYTNFPSYDSLVSCGTDKIQELLENWVLDLTDKGRKATAIKTSLAGVELFLEMNKVIYHKKILHRLVQKDTQELGGSEPITTKEISNMLGSTKKKRVKAIIHFLASTGIRPNAIADPILRKKHLIKLDQGCYAIRVYDNSIEGYWAFLTPEASEALDTYHKSRSFNGETLTDESPLFVNEFSHQRKNGIKHLTSTHMKKIMHEILKTAGVSRVKTGHRYNIAGVYGFRKRFNTILKNNNHINSNIAEKLMAHKNGLDGVYFKPTMQDCFNEFLKAIPELTISEESRLKIQNMKQQEELNEYQKLKADFEKHKAETYSEIAKLQHINAMNDMMIRTGQIHPNMTFNVVDEQGNTIKKLSAKNGDTMKDLEEYTIFDRIKKLKEESGF